MSGGHAIWLACMGKCYALDGDGGIRTVAREHTPTKSVERAVGTPGHAIDHYWACAECKHERIWGAHMPAAWIREKTKPKDPEEGRYARDLARGI